MAPIWHLPSILFKSCQFPKFCCSFLLSYQKCSTAFDSPGKASAAQRKGERGEQRAEAAEAAAAAAEFCTLQICPDSYLGRFIRGGNLNSHSLILAAIYTRTYVRTYI